MREALEEHGVAGELLLISDGDRAIRFIEALNEEQADCPDLIILDLNLPRRPGREVLAFIRNSVCWKSAPVVILSSSDAPRDRAEATHLGATRYLRKPSRLHEFLALGAVFKAMLQAPRQN